MQSESGLAASEDTQEKFAARAAQRSRRLRGSDGLGMRTQFLEAPPLFVGFTATGFFNSANAAAIGLSPSSTSPAE